MAQQACSGTARFNSVHCSRHVISCHAAAAHSLSHPRIQCSVQLSGPLEGCYFTLAAIKGSEHEARARRLIQENGGRVFTETTLTRVQGEGGVGWGGVELACLKGLSWRRPAVRWGGSHACAG